VTQVAGVAGRDALEWATMAVLPMENMMSGVVWCDAELRHAADFLVAVIRGVILPRLLVEVRGGNGFSLVPGLLALLARDAAPAAQLLDDDLQKLPI
jgi:hypothetical protein